MDTPRVDRELPPMLTADEASDLLRVRRPQVYALARDGIIPSVRVGRAVRFSRARLEQWIADGGAGLAEAQE
ncbi:MAG: helix-turn-helix domain-containing protein [Trueperaceae bacterium]|nr:helix-turn-helix domain-containing protein [Trueperaceae bacterium]